MTAMTDYVHQPLWAGPAAAVQQAGQVVGIMGQLPGGLSDGVRHDHRSAARPQRAAVGRRCRPARRRGAATDAPILNRVATILGLLGSLNLALFVFNLIPCCRWTVATW
jgi:Zn-dependent protease